MDSTVKQQMNQRQCAWDNHSEALSGEIKSRMFHTPASVCLCVSRLAGSPWETGPQLLSWRDLDTNTGWLMPLFPQQDSFLRSYLSASCFPRFKAMWDAEGSIWEWKLKLSVEVMCRSVSSQACDVLHSEHTIMKVQMVMWESVPSHEL